MRKKKRTVFVGMSGGVDSSVAALLLKKEGYDLVGVFMRCWTSSSARTHAEDDADLRGNLMECEQEQDAEDARRVAEKLNIPFYVWDFEKEYKKRVVEYMVEGYRQGLTPNPDVMCNREIKFGLFLKRALALGADYVATGHYVRLRRTSDKQSSDKMNERRKTMSHVPCPMSLFTARDAQKDQSYFLWTLTQEQLKHCLFPIGDYLKSEVREIARKAGLPTADKKDSQGICFLGKVVLADFLKTYIPEKRGEVLAVNGERIGEHLGAQFYTIGQRHLGIGVRYPAFAKASASRQVSGVRKNFEPFYVTEKNVETNTLTVAEGDEHPALYRKEILLHNVNFINPSTSLIRANGGIEVLARVRYRQPLAEASIKCQVSGIKLVFEKPQKFVAPGQSAVFYKKGQVSSVKGQEKYEMLGGGVIA